MWNTKSYSFSWWLMDRCFETGTECWKVDAHQLANTRGIRNNTVEASHGCHLRNWEVDDFFVTYISTSMWPIWNQRRLNLLIWIVELPISIPIMGSNAEMHRRSIEEAYGSIWRIGNKEMGDDVDWVSLLNDLRKWFIEGVREGRVKGGVRWWDGLLEELEGRDMIGDIVFNVFFIILGSLEEASLGVFAFIVLWLVE